jgi:hypothetical protein
MGRIDWAYSEERFDDVDGLPNFGQSGGQDQDDGVGHDEELHPADSLAGAEPVAPALGFLLLLCATKEKHNKQISQKMSNK